jgi:ribonucleoside-diphosphate reductase beta chain
MLAVMAQIVEGIIFLAGFVAIFSLGQKMVASAQMVAYISKDEINSHLPFFSNVAKTILRENPDLVSCVPEIYSLIDEAVHLETEWLCYITENVLGFKPELNFDFVRSVADERLIALGLKKTYNVPKTHLNKLLDSYTKVNEKRSNFFESKPTTYAKNALNMDDF